MTNTCLQNPSRSLLIAGFICLTLNIGFSRKLPAIQVHDETPIELSGFSISEAFEIEDDKPLDLDSPQVKKLLYRIKKTSPRTRREYSELSKALTWDAVVQQTEDHRLWVFDRKARLKRIEKHRFSDANDDAEIKGLFVCHCLNEQGQPFVALARTIPRSLKPGIEFDEPVGVVGFLYARATLPNSEIENDEPMPVFVIDRLAWYPDKPSDDVPASHVQLASKGVDIGLIDFVRDSNTQPLNSRDAEAFYQFLAGVGKIGQPTESGDPKLAFEDIMQNANAKFGQLVSIKGIVRTCTAIEQTDQDIQNRLGISRHYQLMLFPDLDGAKIIVKNKNGEQLNYRRFPVTVCCTQLPAGMSPHDLERKAFVVEGVFFRFWKYQSDKTDLAGTSGQVSPLIMATALLPVDLQEKRLDFMLLIFVIVVIGGIAALIYGFRRADRNQKSPAEKMLESLPDRIDVSGLND